ncbi:DUF1684 domain-containing protein [Herbiconiux sp.]|uniref:DUF1684 domain-containing protein n=1 Tax=Herbiconiux sp. TaxID=1871186 RepID=UPI0025B7F315|nr:DUF1684 domain-containing protein [Herbiconiux sp.]
MSDTEFDEDWQAWHKARLRTVTAPHGLASLVGTHWLSPDPQPVEGLEGEWSLDGAAIVGPTFTIDEGGEVLLGGRLLRNHRRDDDVALRILDPDAPSRASVADIEAYEPDPAWVLKGHFRPADGERIDVTEIDGYVENQELAGVVEVEVAGQKLELLATGPLTRLHVVFKDATSGEESYRFRFLFLRADAGSGEIEVDFNRAVLPPCAFADFYLCPLPAPQNVIEAPVRAGEKQVVRH